MTSTGQASDLRRALSASMFDIVAAAGLDRLTVREVAARAGVSIGAVQHHFATKEAMLAAAFDEAVGRTRRRVDALRLDAGPRANITAVLLQLLPLDAERRAEAVVHLAFAGRATVSPELARVQTATLRAISGEISAAVTTIGAAVPRHPDVTARLLLAGVDGLALHAVSAPRLLTARQLTTAVDALVDSLLP